MPRGPLDRGRSSIRPPLPPDAGRREIPRRRGLALSSRPVELTRSGLQPGVVRYCARTMSPAPAATAPPRLQVAAAIRRSSERRGGAARTSAAAARAAHAPDRKPSERRASRSIRPPCPRRGGQARASSSRYCRTYFPRMARRAEWKGPSRRDASHGPAHCPAGVSRGGVSRWLPDRFGLILTRPRARRSGLLGVSRCPPPPDRNCRAPGLHGCLPARRRLRSPHRAWHLDLDRLHELLASARLRRLRGAHLNRRRILRMAFARRSRASAPRRPSVRQTARTSLFSSLKDNAAR